MEFMEKRKAERLPVDLILGVSELFKQDNEVIKNVNAPIEVVDISRRGIGFHSESDLPLEFYFNARIASLSASLQYLTIYLMILKKRLLRKWENHSTE